MMTGQLFAATETGTHPQQLIDPVAIRAFALAGNARLTLVSRRTGKRYTYRIRQPRPSAPHFVQLLTGSDNESGYTFLGSLFDTPLRTKEYSHGKRSPIRPMTESVRAFVWFWKALEDRQLSPLLEVWHEGRCGRCGRTLTVPSSIANGIGPECANKISHQE